MRADVRGSGVGAFRRGRSLGSAFGHEIRYFLGERQPPNRDSQAPKTVGTAFCGERRRRVQDGDAEGGPVGRTPT
jgi:hypothetical protein